MILAIRQHFTVAIFQPERGIGRLDHFAGIAHSHNPACAIPGDQVHQEIRGIIGGLLGKDFHEN